MIMKKPRGRIISLGGEMHPPASEFAGQPFVAVCQSNWRENGTGIVVFNTNSGVIGRDRPHHDTPSQLHITSRPGILKVTRSLQGNAESGFAEEPYGEEHFLRGTLRGLSIERNVSNYDDRTRQLLDLSGRGPTGDLVVVGDQIDRLRGSLDKSDHPLAVHAAAIIEVATKHL